MFRRLHANGWDLADCLLAGVANADYWPERGTTKILDYGCGAGALVYRLRDLGYEAYGFDIHDRVDYRSDADRAWFRFNNNDVADTSDYVIDPATFRIGFGDDTFDLVVSTSVLEHVIEIEPVMRETARVLKPDGVAFHLYPKATVVIEPHIFVPLSSVIQPRSWFWLWAALGIRNQHQIGKSVAETVESNVRFARTGLRYRTRRELRRICAAYFDDISFRAEAFFPGADFGWALRKRLASLKTRPILWEFVMGQTLEALCTSRKRPTPG